MENSHVLPSYFQERVLLLVWLPLPSLSLLHFSFFHFSSLLFWEGKSFYWAIFIATAVERRCMALSCCSAVVLLLLRTADERWDQVVKQNIWMFHNKLLRIWCAPPPPPPPPLFPSSNRRVSWRVKKDKNKCAAASISLLFLFYFSLGQGIARFSLPLSHLTFRFESSEKTFAFFF